MKKTTKTWIRRDRQTGNLEEINKDQARLKLQGYYHDVTFVMSHASQDMPMTTGFCDYWPK